MIKKIVFLIVPLILLTSHLSQKIHRWYQAKKEVAEIQVEINQLQKERKELEEKKEYCQTEKFIRREAREKLGLTDQNDLVLILPELPNLGNDQKGTKIRPDSPHWKQWWDLFFKKSSGRGGS